MKQGGKERTQRPRNRLSWDWEIRQEKGKNNETWVQILASLGFSLLNSEIKERISSCRVC